MVFSSMAFFFFFLTSSLPITRTSTFFLRLVVIGRPFYSRADKRLLLLPGRNSAGILSFLALDSHRKFPFSSRKGWPQIYFFYGLPRGLQASVFECTSPFSETRRPFLPRPRFLGSFLHFPASRFFSSAVVPGWSIQ